MAWEQKHVLAASRAQAWSGNMTASRCPSRHDHSQGSETSEAYRHPPKTAANEGFQSSYQGEADEALLWDTPKHRSTATGRRDGLMGDDTFNRIQSIIASNLEIVPIKVTLPTSFIDDLQADSLDMIELIIAFEDAFDVVIPDIAVETIVTVQDAVDYIKQQQQQMKKSRRSDMSGS
jgi:acyl carrier protein